MEVVRKSCPECGDVLVVGGGEHGVALICRDACCEYEEPLPEHVFLRLLGALTLPGFGDAELTRLAEQAREAERAG